MEKLEKNIQKDFLGRFPILKDYDAKSLRDDKTWWLYDVKTWIIGGSITSMMLLFLCLMRNKIPYVRQMFSVIIIS
ncbi:MAG TPA: hypothetical protein VLB80_02845 [Candidatus Babeliales bacterium]|nr:hypothetical protein [Candidatus Babeliales bacterium]